MDMNYNNQNSSTVEVDSASFCKLEMMCLDLGVGKKDFIKAAVDYFWNKKIDPRDRDVQKSSKEILDGVNSIKEQLEAQSTRLSNMGSLVVSISGDTQWLSSRVSRMVKHWWNR